MSLSRFWTLTAFGIVLDLLQFETTCHWFPNCACLCCVRHFVVHLRLCPTFHGFVRAVVVLHARTMFCVFITSLCTTFETILSCFSDMMLRVLVFFTFLTAVPSCPDMPLQNAQANHYLRRGFFQSLCSFLLIIPAEIMAPHVQKDFPSAMCALHFSHCVVSSSAMSVFH